MILVAVATIRLSIMKLPDHAPKIVGGKKYQTSAIHRRRSFGSHRGSSEGDVVNGYDVVTVLSLVYASIAAVTAWIVQPQQQHLPTYRIPLAAAPLSNDGWARYVKRNCIIQPASTTTRCAPSSAMSEDNMFGSTISTELDTRLFSAIDLTEYELMEIPERGKVETNAVYGSLLKSNCIERYDVYRRRCPQNHPTTTISSSMESPPDVLAIVTVGSNLDGHFRVVHGGVIALIIDDVLGFGYFAILLNEQESLQDRKHDNQKDYPDVIAVTANLNINYRTPVPSGTTFIVEATLVSDKSERERRPKKNKFHWDVQVLSPDRNVTYCHASSLYVIPKRQAQKVTLSN
jgi:acyl-coenzyme A thioesterase PaaI-like protein